MAKKLSQKLSLKIIDKTRFYFIEEIHQNEMTSKKDRKVCTTSNCMKYLLILISTVTWCVSVSIFTSLGGIPIGITSSYIPIGITSSYIPIGIGITVDSRIKHLLNNYRSEVNNSIIKKK